MAGTTNLNELIQSMTPKLNEGSYVFVTTEEPISIDRAAILCEFKETEGTTLVLEKNKADQLKLRYDFFSFNKI